MNQLAAGQAIEEALRTRRIGQPVAVRIVAQGDQAGAGDELPHWAEAVAAKWLDDQPATATVFASAAGRQRSVLLRMQRGGMALLTTGAAENRPRNDARSILDVAVFGNHGVIAWQDAAAEAAGATIAPLPWPERPSSERSGVEPPYGVLLIAGDCTHQPNYAAALAADPRCRLIAVSDAADVDPRRQRLNEEFAARLGLPLLPDLDAALARPDVQIVSVCAEPIRRGPIIVRASRAGKHLYLDKPLAGSAEQAAEIVAAIEQAGVLGHMFSLVHTDAACRLRRLIEGGTLGELQAVHCDLTFAKGHAGSAALGRPRRETALPTEFELADAKRELTNIGVYPLALLLAVLECRVTRVAAATGNFFSAEHQACDMEDFGMMLLETDRDIVCSCTIGRTGWHSHPRGGINRTLLIGSQGTAVIDADRPRAELCSDGPAWPTPPRNPDDPMGMWQMPHGNPFRAAAKTTWFPPPPTVAADATHFLDCLQFGRRPTIEARLAAAASQVLSAAYRSAATGRPEPLQVP